MNKISIIEKFKTIQIGKEPMVLLPLELWQKFGNYLDNYLEDQEALSSKKFLRRIKQARKDIKVKKLIHPFHK